MDSPKARLLRMIILAASFILFTSSIAWSQKSLKITRMRQITWDTVSRVWSPWPATWNTYPQGNQPILTITGKDSNDYAFHIDMQVGGQTYSFDVDYNGFDEKNNWTKYMDEHGDEIAIVGTAMTYLSQNGWPGNPVHIYFWIYTNHMAEELE
ncbi:MAG TPA: hypothetical protein VG367_00900 [Mucilaginibacter sp.]|jgi:hypothetical protein|nr:hypothetical protein [Mucilaginibacter sp.]